MSKRVSIIIPMFNEEQNIDRLFERLRPVITQIRDEFGYVTEVVINDNASVDGTFHRLLQVAADHDEDAFDLRIFRFSKNVGFQRSILAGYHKATGDAVMQIDADLQDPPELLIEFVRRWKENKAKVVYGVRRRRIENPLLAIARKVFYRLLNWLSPDEIPADSGDFRLIDRVVVDVVCSIKDQDPYLRGLIASVGFLQEGIVYDRDARAYGESKFGLGELFKLALDGITNHSVALLRLSSYLAMLVALAMIIIIVFYLHAWFFRSEGVPLGFMTQVLLELGGVALLASLFSIHGFYLSRVYRQVKERPLAIIETAHDQLGETGPEVLWTGRGAKNA